MNSKPICIASIIVCFFVSCALEGGALSPEQALFVMIPAIVLLLWSFCQTDWYEPGERSGRYESSKVPEMPSGIKGSGKYQHWLR